MTTLSDLLNSGAILVAGKMSAESRSFLSRARALQGAAVAPSEAPAPEAPASAPPAEKTDEALFEEVALQIDVADAEALRADPEARRRFVKQLKNQRALNEESREREAAKRAADANAAKVQQQNRLAALGRQVGKAEQSE